MKNTKHLDVGCGSKPRNPFNCDTLYGIDIIDQDVDSFNYQKCNIVLEKIPFKDSTFDSLSAYDFLEHIPRFAVIENTTQFPFINFMNEAYRVLKDGGVFYAVTPVYPRIEAFTDPTHINIITKKSHKYFVNPRNKAHMYGFNGNFDVRRVKLVRVSQELKKYSPLISFIKNILYTVLFHKKSHIVWEFKAVKKD